ncbi:MAG: hypothetical protein II222_04400 [Paraprevotella sp.]|nr:hypothetical protein [Paraprevotella sp.]
MANKRDLKKSVNFICSELFAECVAVKHYNKELAQADVDPVMVRILTLQNEMLSRANHIEKFAVRAYIKKLREDFNKETSEIIDAITALI